MRGISLPSLVLRQVYTEATSLANYWRERFAIISVYGSVRIIPGSRVAYTRGAELIQMVLPARKRRGPVQCPYPVWRRASFMAV